MDSIKNEDILNLIEWNDLIELSMYRQGVIDLLINKYCLDAEKITVKAFPMYLRTSTIEILNLMADEYIASVLSVDDAKDILSENSHYYFIVRGSYLELDEDEDSNDERYDFIREQEGSLK